MQCPCQTEKSPLSLPPSYPVKMIYVLRLLSECEFVLVCVFERERLGQTEESVDNSGLLGEIRIRENWINCR